MTYFPLQEQPAHKDTCHRSLTIHLVVKFGCGSFQSSLRSVVECTSTTIESESDSVLSIKTEVQGRGSVDQRWRCQNLVTCVQRSLRAEIAFGNISRPTWEHRSTTVLSPNSHWGETAQVFSVQLFSRSNWHSEDAYFETHGGETTSLQSM